MFFDWPKTVVSKGCPLHISLSMHSLDCDENKVKFLGPQMSKNIDKG